MRYLTHSCTDPHRNMAFDEFCLEQLPLEEPVFYLWRNRPSVIIGLNQNAYSEVNLSYLEEHGIVLARRVTGGGAVYHDLQNLNYTIVGRSSDLERDYPGYLHLFCDALRSLGVPAELSGRNDILVGGRKVSGYAKRVWHDRLMVHGTLMYDVDLETLTQALSVPGSKFETASGIASVHARVANLKELLPQFHDLDGLQAALQEILAAGDPAIVLDSAQQAEIERIAREKFATREWNLGRSPLTTFRRSRKFSCGTVEVLLSVERGVITGLHFGGDFLGNRPASELAAALAGCTYEPAAIRAILDASGVAAYFDGLSTQELSTLICPL